MVKIMESFSANSAKSYLGKNVNLHLKDGAVIVNVQLTKLHKGAGKNNSLIEYSLRNRKAGRIPLRTIAYAEMLNINLMKNPA
jgi:Tfp pilus tip-associated adhesin PilY1